MPVNDLAETAPAATAAGDHDEHKAHHDVADDPAELVQTLEAFVASVGNIIDDTRQPHLGDHIWLIYDLIVVILSLDKGQKCHHHERRR